MEIHVPGIYKFYIPISASAVTCIASVQSCNTIYYCYC